MAQKLERNFQSALIDEIKTLLPDCYIFKIDATRNQGMPDLMVVYKDRWALLEVKRNINASKQPNQEYYVEKMNELSYASFIYPENKERVLDELQRALEFER